MVLWPKSYRIDQNFLPSLVNPNIKYDGSQFMLLHWDEVALISKPFPPGIHIANVNPTAGHTWSGTMMDIPFDPSSSPHYLIQFTGCTSSSIPAGFMPNFIPKPAIDISDTSHLLPPFLKIGLRIMFKKDGQYHKGFLSQSPDRTYWFSYKSHKQEARRLGGTTPLNQLPWYCSSKKSNRGNLPSKWHSP